MENPLKKERNFESFEKLPKDVLNKLSEEMSPGDLIRFCQSSASETLKRLCSSNTFWENVSVEIFRSYFLIQI